MLTPAAPFPVARAGPREPNPFSAVDHGMDWQSRGAVMRPSSLENAAGERAGQPVPAHVLDAVQRQQESSEILIGWVQLAVVAAFGALYFLAPKTFNADTMFAPVPWTLATYLVFTLARLALAHSRRLPEWFVHASVIADMGLLLGLIWSFHVQYQQPPSFYLKAPTLLYVFIFIALRALRYEVRYVVLAGGVAATGWLLLAWYAVRTDPTMITRDYVRYMTSNSVLLGAEFDKVISILLVTAILAVAIARARRLLVRAVTEASAAHQLSRFVPTQVAARVTSAEQPVEVGDGEVREATILFTDLEGFTAIGERLSPVELITTLNQYFGAISEPIERHGGVINQFQGDAVLATFNLPAQRADHAAAALRAALEIQRVLAARRFGNGIELRSRVGINTGTVVGGLVGTSDRIGYTVHGDEVNLAARLEQINKAHGTRIICSQRTRQLAGDDGFRFRALGSETVRGRVQPVTLYAVEELTSTDCA